MIVSLNPTTTEILFALGIMPDAVSKVCDFPEAVSKCQRVGSPKSPDYDTIEELKPTLCFTQGDEQESVKAKLESLGFCTCHTNPLTLKDVYESFMQIAQVVHKNDEARALINKIKATLSNDALKVKHKDVIRVHIKDAPKWMIELGPYAGVELYDKGKLDLDTFEPQLTLKPEAHHLRPSPRITQFVEWLGQKAHPEFATFGSMRKDIDAYYEDIELPDPKAQYEN